MQAKTVDLQTGQTIEEILSLLEDDEEIIITRDNVPIARLSLFAHKAQVPEKRVAGLHVGTTWLSDDFDDPLPDSFWIAND